ncbi:uncharacterized protein [Ambystoma mexicanum]|uniref:uncharacterized protein n=1 Tax=Ambystoma mexicanum TaxID=8296 RepID=UPI0037E75543
MPPKHVIHRTFRLNKSLLTMSMLSMALFEVEDLLGGEFKCPQGQALGIAYGLLYFLAPALAWFVLGLRVAAGSSPCCPPGSHSCGASCFSTCCLPFLRACTLPAVWILILLLDGRYDECIIDAMINEQTTTTATAQGVGQYSLYYTYIQMSAIAAIALLIILVVLLTWKCSDAPEAVGLRLFCCCCQAHAKEGCLASMDMGGYELDVTEEVEVVVRDVAWQKTRLEVKRDPTLPNDQRQVQ